MSTDEVVRLAHAFRVAHHEREGFRYGIPAEVVRAAATTEQEFETALRDVLSPATKEATYFLAQRMAADWQRLDSASDWGLRETVMTSYRACALHLAEEKFGPAGEPHDLTY